MFTSATDSLSGIDVDTRILLTFFRYGCPYDLCSLVIFFSVIILASVILQITVRVTDGKSFSVRFNGKSI